MNTNLNNAVIIYLPIVIGLNGLIWAEVVTRVGAGPATLCGALAYLPVGIASFYLAPGVGISRDSLPWLAGLFAPNFVTSTLWILPIHGGTKYVSLALIEGAWPVFSVFFTWLLFRRFELDLISAIGGVLVIVGSALVLHKS